MANGRRVVSAEDGTAHVESVPLDEVHAGDHLLVYAEEELPVTGRLVDPPTDDGVVEAAGALLRAGDEARVTITGSDGDSRPATVGERVAAGETVQGGAVVVEVAGGPAWLPVWARPFLGGLGPNVETLRRVGVLALVFFVALSATGLGANNPVDDFARENSGPISSVVGADGRIDGQGVTPTTPPVDVPPPVAGGGTTTPSSGGGPVSATLDLQAADPATVFSSSGRVGSLDGPVSGRLAWTGEAESATLVVQSWVPDDGWQEVARTTVDGPGPVSLEAALGRLEYANRTRTGPFQNADPGTTKRSTGFVSVTAVLFDDGAEVGRVTATDEFEVTVVHTGDRSRPVNLKVGGQGGRTNVFDIGDDPGTALPGTSGTNRVTLRNDGTRDGVLELRSVEYTSYENGLTGPEAKVDNTGGDPGLGAGELEDALELRASLAFDDGSSRYVIGNASSYRTVASLADVSVPLGELPARESVDLVVEFRVPATTGNEIQSDTIVVDFEFRLVEAD